MASTSTSSAPPLDIEQITTAAANLKTTPLTTIQDLKNQPCLWYKVHVFVYDLRNFREIPDAQARLDRIMDASYIDLPYFTPDEVHLLKSSIVEGDKTLEGIIEETLNERLERRIKKRVESGDFRVCAAHDLAPIFEKVFDIKSKDLAKNEEFLTILGRSGLDLKDGDGWKGLPKKKN
ncbi:Uncharacterized protein BP5553_09001 [Venustampulla echinocandica]|uniref:Uncharacterized protein n=1 Tax=Venustampulla echinocandica TaxID=2656787 RepID=A0A370TDK7_9HELO|nr:Uncharacterized protein BP5553_09001 [Venustampulla echinocandica]RDL32545.1 Uncharacterized protein BP5553_09001 [Venustampulla echinocandica]